MCSFFRVCKMIWLICLVSVNFATALKLEKVQEGSCKEQRYESEPSVDAKFIDNLRYIVAGSKYHIYRSVSSHPRFSHMREHELFYDACLTRNGSSSTSIPHGSSQLSGFRGVPLGQWTLTIKKRSDGSLDSIKHWQGSRAVLEQRVVLTDHHTFAMMAGCWLDTNQRTWDIYSLTREKFPLKLRQLVEDLVVFLGFDRKQIIFLNKNNCRSDRGGGSIRDDDKQQHNQRSLGSRVISRQGHQIDRQVQALPAGEINSEDLLRHLNSLHVL